MAFDGLKVWFLTGSQDLYGEVILAKVLAQSKEMVDGLSASAAGPRGESTSPARPSW